MTPECPPSLDFLLTRLALPHRLRVVDVGANPRGEQAPYAGLLAIGACDVVGFEPNPEAFAKLETAGPDPRSEHTTYLPFAVGDGTDKVFRIFKDDSMGSVYDPYLPGTKLIPFRNWHQIVDRVPVRTVALDTSPDIKPFDLLKIDIQGGEVDVFRGGRTILSGAVAVIVELRYFRLYEGEPMLGGVDIELRDQGFELHKFRFNKARGLRNSQSHRLKRRRTADQLIDGDAIYVRDISRPEHMTDDQLARLAILSNAVFDSHTLCLVCLDELVRRGRIEPAIPAQYVDSLPPDLRLDAGESDI